MACSQPNQPSQQGLGSHESHEVKCATRHHPLRQTTANELLWDTASRAVKYRCFVSRTKSWPHKPKYSKCWRSMRNARRRQFVPPTGSKFCDSKGDQWNVRMYVSSCTKQPKEQTPAILLLLIISSYLFTMRSNFPRPGCEDQ